jgi:hypothetical protein
VEIYPANVLDKTCENQPQSFGEMIVACEKAIYDLTPETLENIETYIFTLKELGYSDEIIKLLDAFIIGYCYNTSDQKKYIIFSLYKGLVIATIFWNNRVIFVPSSINDFFNSLQSKNALKASLKEEIDYMLEQIKKACAKNQEILNSNNTMEKLKKRYENAKRLR